MPSFSGLGPALVRLRQLRGLKAREVAERARITKAMLSSYENDKQEPSLGSLRKILDAMDVDLQELQLAIDWGQGELDPRRSLLGRALLGLGTLGSEERAALADAVAGVRRFCDLVEPTLRADPVEPESEEAT
jgi:transcriptional regulator with XRE-family HTH domain